MVYDRSTITDKFRGLIGFMPTYDNSNQAAKVDDALKVSKSGHYINGLHNLFSAEVFSSVSGLFSEYVVTAWSAGATYSKKSIVSYNTNNYISLRETTGANPDTSPEDWRKTTLLTEWIWDKYDSAVLTLIDKVVEANKLSGYGKELRGNTPLYEGNGMPSNLVVKSGRFVGYEITPSEFGVSLNLQRIGMQLDRPATVPIHIIRGEDDQVINLNFTGNGRQHNYLDVEPLPFFEGDGPVVIGYYEDDLGAANAISMDTSTYYGEPCYGCGGSGVTGWRNVWSKWMSLSPFSEKDDVYTPDNSTNFGLNLGFSFRCDLSDVFIRERQALSSALRAQLKVTFLEALSMNIRNNKQADQVGNIAYQELEEYKNPFNPKFELNKSIKALQFDLTGLGTSCIPCVSSSRVRIRNGVM